MKTSVRVMHETSIKLDAFINFIRKITPKIIQKTFHMSSSRETLLKEMTHNLRKQMSDSQAPTDNSPSNNGKHRMR